MNTFYMKKLQEELKNSGFSAILISPGEELDFLLDFEPLFCERFQGLFVKADGTCFYICNLLYAEEFKQALPPEIPIYSWFDGDVMTEVVAKVLKEQGLLGTVIGVNSTAQAFNVLEIMEHDVVLMDFGCTVGGMYSDMTRTVFVGEPTEQEREIYELVRRANEGAEELVREGAFVPDIDQRARDILDEKGYAWSLVNRLGHGVGYTIHEAPDIKRSNPMHLEKGMAFTIEPGIYLPGTFGVRVEDVVIINENGEREILNHATKDLIVL